MYGGGLANYRHSNPLLTHITLLTNTATITGGGLYNNASSPTKSFRNPIDIFFDYPYTELLHSFKISSF